MKTIDKNIKQITRKLWLMDLADEPLQVMFYKDGRYITTDFVSGSYGSMANQIKLTLKRPKLKNAELDKIEIFGVNNIEIQLKSKKPRLKRIYQSGNLYVSDLTQSGTFEFDTDINAAFDFIDWGYDDLLYHEFFRNSTGKFLLVEDNVICGELQLFSTGK